jgi:hypothetical protein
MGSLTERVAKQALGSICASQRRQEEIDGSTRGKLVCISAPFVCISGEWVLPVATSGAKVGES